MQSVSAVWMRVTSYLFWRRAWRVTCVVTFASREFHLRMVQAGLKLRAIAPDRDLDFPMNTNAGTKSTSSEMCGAMKLGFALPINASGGVRVE